MPIDPKVRARTRSAPTREAIEPRGGPATWELLWTISSPPGDGTGEPWGGSPGIQERRHDLHDRTDRNRNILEPQRTVALNPSKRPIDPMRAFRVSQGLSG